MNAFNKWLCKTFGHKGPPVCKDELLNLLNRIAYMKGFAPCIRCGHFEPKEPMQ